MTVSSGAGYEGYNSSIITAIESTGNKRLTATLSGVTAGQTHTSSIYVRRVSGSGTVQFENQGSTSGGDHNVTSQVGSDWTRIDTQFNGSTSGGVVTAFAIRLFTEGDSLEIAAPQVEIGGSPTTFVANTTGNPKFITGATFGPRVPMILVEPSATNTIRWSESSSAYNYGSGITFASSDILAPNGQSSAFKMTPDGSNNTNRGGSSYSGFYNTNDVVTMSVWLKTDGYDYFLRVGGFFGSESALFDSLDGSLKSTEGNVISASSEDYGNGWFRYKITYTFQNTINNRYLYAGVRLAKRDASNNPVELFDGTGETTGVLVYGTQFELGSVATSYIPTDNDVSGVTRAADDLVISGSAFTDFFNNLEGTTYVEIVPKTAGDNTTNLPHIFEYHNSSDANANRMGIYLPTLTLNAFVRSSGVTTSLVTVGNVNLNQLNRVAVSYKVNDILASLNGPPEVSDTSAALSSGIDTLHIGNVYSFAFPFLGHIKRFIYWPTHSDNL
jgi:hypothetical protein